MSVRWTQPTTSGLGDRLIDLYMLAAYARARRVKLYTDWPIYDPKSIDAPYRVTDILLENVLKFLRFPPEIVFDNHSPTRDFFNHSIGGGGDLNDFYRAYASPFCTHDEFKSILAAVAKDFGFCPAIEAFLETIPPKFVAFHIRRTDRVRNETPDGTYIHASELDWLNNLTFKAIDYYIAQGYDTFFVCGDEDQKNVPFVEYIEKVKIKHVFKIPEMPKWQGTYYDLAVMTRSDFNVTSQRYSSFSRFPSFIGTGSFTSVCNLNHRGLI